MQGVGIRAIQQGHWQYDGSAVEDIHISEDGRFLSTAYKSGAVVLWTVPHLELLCELSCALKGGAQSKGGTVGAVPMPLCVQVAPYMPYVAVGYQDGKVCESSALESSLDPSFKLNLLPVLAQHVSPGPLSPVVLGYYGRR